MRHGGRLSAGNQKCMRYRGLHDYTGMAALRFWIGRGGGPICDGCSRFVCPICSTSPLNYVKMPEGRLTDSCGVKKLSAVLGVVLKLVYYCCVCVCCTANLRPLGSHRALACRNGRNQVPGESVVEVLYLFATCSVQCPH